MKKIKNNLGIIMLIMVAIVCVPKAVKAEDTQIFLESIHNQISDNNKLNVKSIPIDKYEESAYYNKCMQNYNGMEGASENCKSAIYGLVVNSYLNYTFEKMMMCI